MLASSLATLNSFEPTAMRVWRVACSCVLLLALASCDAGTTTSAPTAQSQAAKAMQEAVNTTGSAPGGAKAAAARKGGSAMSTSAAQTLWRALLAAGSDAEGALLALQQGDRGLVRGATYRVQGMQSTQVSAGTMSIDVGTSALRPVLEKLREQIAKAGQDDQLAAWQALDQVLAGVHESTNDFGRDSTGGAGTLPGAGTAILTHRLWVLEAMSKLGDAALEYAPMRARDAMRESLSSKKPMNDVP